MFAIVALGSGDVGELLGVFQSRFVKALADPKGKQLSRECACRGLAACYGLAKARGGGVGGDEMNEKLLRAFGQTTNHGGSAMMESRVQEVERRAANAEARTGGGMENALLNAMEEHGSMTSEGGQAGVSEAALGAYREMAAAAVELGGGGGAGEEGGSEEKNLLYYLMCLSTTHTVWELEGNKVKYSASLLLGDGAEGGGGKMLERLRENMKPHLKKLTPKLLRACNDPNAQTREQMGVLWDALTGGKADGRQVIKDNLTFTIDSLCKDSTSRLWRARVGALGALADVFVGRDWKELGGGEKVVVGEDWVAGLGVEGAADRLLELWRITMRGMDDVRGGVREAAGGVGKSLRSLTVRLCDVKSEGVNEEEAAAAVTTILTWLLKYGLTQPCDEATGCCISTLLGVIEVAKAETLYIVLPKLVSSLICAMSGLEPNVLNYLAMRMGGSEEGAEKLESLRLQMAQSGPIGDALNKCVDVIKFSKLEIQRDIVGELDFALRSCVGGVSRAAVADVVNSLCASSPAAFGGGGGGSCVKLLRGLYYASERERGGGARDKLLFALGNLSALAPDGAVRSLVKRLIDNWARACSSNGSLSGRKAR